MPKVAARKLGTDPDPRSRLQSPQKISCGAIGLMTAAIALATLLLLGSVWSSVLMRWAVVAPHANASRNIVSAAAGPTVITTTGAFRIVAVCNASSSAAWSAGDGPDQRSSVTTAALSESISGRSDTHFMQTTIGLEGEGFGVVSVCSKALAMAKDHAVSAFGVCPGDGALVVADHVTGPAFKALFVVKENAAVVGRHEKLGRTRIHTRLGGAATTDVGIDRDVGLRRNAKIDSFHAVIEAERRVTKHRTTLERRRPRVAIGSGDDSLGSNDMPLNAQFLQKFDRKGPSNGAKHELSASGRMR